MQPESGDLRLYRSGVNVTLRGYNASGSGAFVINTNGNSYINSGNVGIGTTNPGSYKLYVNGSTYLNGATTINGQATFKQPANFEGGVNITGNITMTGGDIKSANKITAAVFDPHYNIKGTNYSTFAASIAGGLIEEYIGR